MDMDARRDLVRLVLATGLAGFLILAGIALVFWSLRP